MPPHLEVKRFIASGGMGEIWEVEDKRFKLKVPGQEKDDSCRLALKVIRHTKDSAAEREKFFQEINITASLQHPGVVSVREFGLLPEPSLRAYFTMTLVKGDVFSEYFGRRPRKMRSLRELVDVLYKVAQTVAFAHKREFVHLDLKPSNVRVGEFGEVIVLDWGIALAHGVGTGPCGGTEQYQSPEQQTPGAKVSFPADVYALGVMLQELIADKAAQEPDEELDLLRKIARKARSNAVSRRYPNALRFADALKKWLDGSLQRAQGLRIVEKAGGIDSDIKALREEAAKLREQAVALEAPLKLLSPEALKRPLWACQDRIAQLEQAIRLREIDYQQQLYASFTHAPNLKEARTLLADHYYELHKAAEESGDGQRAAEWELLLRQYNDKQYDSWLKGDGTLSLATEPAGAEVTLFPYIAPNRRLELDYENARSLGKTPLSEVGLPRGSYCLRIEAEGYAPCWHPVLIRRNQHEEGHVPIRLLRPEELGQDDVFVTPGRTIVGSDPGASNACPSKVVEVDGFIIRRYPVTIREFLVFLNALVAKNRTKDALAFAPPGPPNAPDRLRVDLGEEGFRLSDQPDKDGLVWDEDWPVIYVDQDAARAYAAWETERTGKTWGLPDELQWERAARGADGRIYPWGNFLEPTWVCYIHGHQGRIQPPRVSDYPASYPVDESPFGVLGLGGGVRDWCERVWPTPKDLPRISVVRGGAWNLQPTLVRAATRTDLDPTSRSHMVGFRLARCPNGASSPAPPEGR